MTDQFKYISVLLSIVVALSLTHLLAGIAATLRARIERVSWVHLAWIGILLFSCVDYWFSTWALRGSEEWSLLYVGYLLALATLLYVSCHLIVPDVRSGESIDLAEFNEANRRKYLSAYFVYIACAAIANLTIAGFASAIVINAVTLVLVAIAWRWGHRRVQGAVAVLMICIYVVYAATYIPSL